MERVRRPQLWGMVIFIFSLVFSTGCKQLQPVVSTESHSDTVVTCLVRDTTFILRPDSAAIRAHLECDSLNRVVMRSLEIEKGRKITPEVRYKFGVLEVTAKVDSEAVFLSWKERHVQVTDSVKVAQTITVTEKPPWYKTLLTNTVVCVFACLLIITIIKIINLLKK
jgi:hypothetical protein